jgi:hypothetical protein
MRVFPRLAIVLTDLAPWATTARSHTWRQAARLVAALAQKRQDLVDSVFDEDRGGRSKLTSRVASTTAPSLSPSRQAASLASAMIKWNVSIFRN